MLMNFESESVVPGQPSSLNVRSFGNMVFATWLPPADRSIAIKGYILSYGIGIPEVFKQMFDAKHRQYTVKNLSESLIFKIGNLLMWMSCCLHFIID